MSLALHLLLATTAIGTALWLRPWRLMPPGGPPWPWLLWAALMPALWGADRYVDTPVAQPLSGACLLLLMGGWPLAVLAMVPVAMLTGWLGDLGAAAALERYVWLGLVPATLTLAIGAAIRRWLPHHLMVYILGRGFFATVAASSLSGVAWVMLAGASNGLQPGDMMLARWLAGWGDAWLTGVLVAISVAFRPEWLATYTDRIYLPKD